jgi:rifampicin phosphotransferase
MTTRRKDPIIDAYVLGLDRCTPESADRIGGKGLGLGRLVAQGFSVPDGFVVTVEAYHECIAPIGDSISTAMASAGTTAGDEAASTAVAALFDGIVLTHPVRAAIDASYAMLGDDVPVAVRSSATAEDAADASFAGQQDTYLWIRGAENVARQVVACWASLYTARAVGYRARQHIAPHDLAMAVVVQRMAPAESAGVMMTLEPAAGDRSVVYIESAHGLGEIVVRGEVEPDRFLVAKNNRTISSAQIGYKPKAYRFDADSGEVRLVEVQEPEATAASLSEAEVRALADLGCRVEEAFGRPMDIEWAVGRATPDGPREIFLLQARPETVWSSRPTQIDGVTALDDKDDPLTSATATDMWWSTSNVGEAMPGVQTPLSWTVWSEGGDRSLRAAAHALGLFRAAEREVPAAIEDRFIRIFNGRVACQVNYLATLGDRMPGMSGPATVASLFGRVPEGQRFQPTRRRYPIVAWRLPVTFLSTPRKARAMKSAYDAWWAHTVKAVVHADQVQARLLFAEAQERTARAMELQAISVFGVMQPVFEALQRLVTTAGAGDLSALAGPTGGVEMTIVEDLWAASRGRLSIQDVLAQHGFHGPMEGELSSHTWREDSRPVQRMIEQYAQCDDTNSPLAAEQKRRAARPALEQQVLDALPAWRRPAARLILWLARTLLPQRGLTKRAFLQGFDTARASARRIGELHVAAGRFDTVDEVFMLTAEELLAPVLPDDVRTLVARRRVRHEWFSTLEPLTEWQGPPPRLPRSAAIVPSPATAAAQQLSGIGVSGGIVEGPARVLHTPDFEQVAANEILVAPTTDPSWASIMFISRGLVVDVGGALSHAAVVARELAIPCVVNTRTGTRSIRTGDLLRVDGTTGLVDILGAAPETTSDPSPDQKRQIDSG